jgi:hypothetical protein
LFFFALPKFVPMKAEPEISFACVSESTNMRPLVWLSGGTRRSIFVPLVSSSGKMKVLQERRVSVRAYVDHKSGPARALVIAVNYSETRGLGYVCM